MTQRCVSLPGALALCAIVLATGVHARQAPPPQIQTQTQNAKQDIPAFRSRITLVPLDVRVLDRDGRPVTDLGRDDFTVLENGEPQVVAMFSASGLVPEAPPPQSQFRPGLRQASGIGCRHRPAERSCSSSGAAASRSRSTASARSSPSSASGFFRRIAWR